MARSREFLHRPMLLFALLLLGPALGFSLLGWNSVGKEREFRARDAELAAQDVVTRRVSALADDIRLLGERESSRDYYEYQRRYMPQQQIALQQLAFQRTSLVGGAGQDPRIAGRFQWELTPRGMHQPDVLAGDAAPLRETLTTTYGPLLRGHLEAARDGAVRAWRDVSYPLRIVQANEERGQLIEELDLQERAPRVADGDAQSAASDSPYLRSFQQRAGAEPLIVRYTPFRYVAAPAGASGPPLLAWRVVWIPAEYLERREVRRARWLLQGYVLDPRPAFPSTWTTEAGVELVRGDAAVRSSLLGSEMSVDGLATGSLARELRAEIVGALESPSLLLLGRADANLADQAFRDARARFLLLVSALVIVVAVGFIVLMRGVRREIALARRKEDFIAAITHELKTPLTGIRMYADMLKQGWAGTPEASEKYANRILDETERLGNLVNQVLDLAALERGVADVNATPGDLGEAVADAASLMRAKADEAGVALAVDVEPDLPIVAFDTRLVRPLVLNLIDNAIKYSDRAEQKDVRVAVRADGERVVVSVADKGVGISPAARKTLFEPFQRAGDEMTRSAPGVGIGMALVKRYAEAHRARVVVDSEVGVGTTISVRFLV